MSEGRAPRDTIKDMIDRLDKDIRDLRDEAGGISEKVIDHHRRLENGRFSFESVTHKHNELEKRVEKLEPKAPDWVKLLLAGLTVISILMGAQMWITSELNHRPLRDEVAAQFAELKLGMTKISSEIQEVKREQVDLRLSLIREPEPEPQKKRR